MSVFRFGLVGPNFELKRVLKNSVKRNFEERETG